MFVLVVGAGRVGSSVATAALRAGHTVALAHTCTNTVPNADSDADPRADAQSHPGPDPAPDPNAGAEEQPLRRPDALLRYEKLLDLHRAIG